MRILGIETSCDETAAAIVEDGTKTISNVVASSAEIHAKTGGIIPENAAREQLKCIIPVIEEALNKENSPANIDAIAVTVGPGLVGSLLVGVETAKTLAYAWQKPIIPVNHLLAHLYANWLETETSPQFPAVALAVSGGHTDLILMKDHEQISWIGGTRDDAAGEAFDKSARVLGLGYPGGPAIALEAAKYVVNNKPQEIKLPRPMINEKNFDFSFSGLKTAVIREVQKLKENDQFNDLTIQELSYELQEAITDVLVSKTIKAAEKYQVKSILLAGGVSANQRLREKMQQAVNNKQYTLHIPPSKLCTDNAAYIAVCAHFHRHPTPWSEIKVQPGLSITGEL